MWEKLRNFSTEEIISIIKLAELATVEISHINFLKELNISPEDYKCLEIKINNFVESL
jgi:hypothetical protein